MTLFGSGFHNFDAKPESVRCIWGAANVPTHERFASVPSVLEDDRTICDSVSVSDEGPYFYFDSATQEFVKYDMGAAAAGAASVADQLLELDVKFRPVQV